jgi:putative membrane protein
MMMGGGLILTLLVLVVVIWAIIKLVPDWQERLGLNDRREDSRGEDSAEETLRQRFARGEIEAEEYEERRRILMGESPAAHRANADGGSPIRPMPPGE